MSLEQIILLIVAGVGGIWAVIKILLPRIVDARIEEDRDAREFGQEVGLKRVNYEMLQSSWQQERLATLLEENESFIREQLWKKLEEIETKAYRSEMTLAQFRDALTVNGRELYEIDRRLRIIETKLRLLIELTTGENVSSDAPKGVEDEELE